MIPPSKTEALHASITLARRLGIVGQLPQVIADGYSLRVRLGPVITRVMTIGVTLRGDPLPWLRREVETARWLASQRAAIVPPWPDAGPHEVDGLWVSVWPFVGEDEAPQTGERDAAAEDEALTGGAEFGRRLGELHRILQRCPLDLPVLVGPQADITAAMQRSDHPLLHRAARSLLPRIEGWPRQPLHGDAHTGNLLRTAGGLCWIDFEDACLGPPEWDLASATLKPDAVAGYPASLDAQRLSDCRDLRRLQTLASLLFCGDSIAGELEPLISELGKRY